MTAGRPQASAPVGASKAHPPGTSNAHTASKAHTLSKAHTPSGSGSDTSMASARSAAHSLRDLATAAQLQASVTGGATRGAKGSATGGVLGSAQGSTQAGARDLSYQAGTHDVSDQAGTNDASYRAQTSTTGQGVPWATRVRSLHVPAMHACVLQATHRRWHRRIVLCSSLFAT